MTLKGIQAIVFTAVVVGCADPYPIESNFVDPADVIGNTQYNSCCGRTFPDDATTSKKHYLKPATQYLGTYNKLQVYAPCSGTVSVDLVGTGCADGSARGYQISIACRKNRSATVILFHQNPIAGLATGNVVKAGQLISYAQLYCATNTTAQNNLTDFDIGYLISGTKNAASVFDHMTSTVLRAWINRGLNTTQLYATTANTAACDFSNAAAQATLCASETLYFP
jgi:hypothetical protein